MKMFRVGAMVRRAKRSQDSVTCTCVGGDGEGQYVLCVLIGTSAIFPEFPDLTAR